MSDLPSDRQTVFWGSASMNILSLLGPWGWSFGRLLILMLAGLGLAANPSARSAELTTKPNDGGEAGAMGEPRYLLFWRTRGLVKPPPVRPAGPDVSGPWSLYILAIRVCASEVGSGLLARDDAFWRHQPGGSPALEFLHFQPASAPQCRVRRVESALYPRSQAPGRKHRLVPRRSINQREPVLSPLTDRDESSVQNV